MSKRIESLKIVENKRLSKDLFVLELSGQGRIPEMKPGQFVQVRIEDSQSTFLRRPFLGA